MNAVNGEKKPATEMRGIMDAFWRLENADRMMMMMGLLAQLGDHLMLVLGLCCFCPLLLLYLVDT